MAVSTTTVVAGAKAAVKAAKASIKAGRRSIAKKEMRDAKDYDGNGRIGSVGRRKRVQRPARG
jgi:hypothetical protein